MHRCEFAQQAVVLVARRVLAQPAANAQAQGHDENEMMKTLTPGEDDTAAAAKAAAVAANNEGDDRDRVYEIAQKNSELMRDAD